MGGFVEGVCDRGDRRTVADPDNGAITDLRSEDFRGQTTDHPPTDIFRAGQARRQMDTAQPEAFAELVSRRRGLRRPVDDPDLDDPLGASALQQPRDLRTGDTE